ncbi:39S ribosomal protein L37, mitochondrial isoform X2 [Phlebotomus papatasi]|nr:39S ribosomal protein L37, mitochondrial isoform X2 [Phlebotomus papatasi]XP_055697489.1 39S ribosomal protein L37, mitochondrial isoform X2 [Phlebotomus papatasi]
MVKRHWLTSSKKILNNGEIEEVAKQLEILNSNIVDANAVFSGKNNITQEPHKKRVPGEIYYQGNHQIYSYSTDSLLIEGVRQAQVLTNTIVLGNLPSRYVKFLDNLKIPDTIHEDVMRSIFSAHLFDAEQKKTKKLHDQFRPAFNFPRVYGITEERKNLLILDKLIRHSERLMKNKANTNLQKRVLNDALVKVTFEKDGNEIRMDLLANQLISSTKPIEKVEECFQKNPEALPDLFPLKHTSSLKIGSNEEWEDLYPINSGNPFPHPHTVFTTFSSNTKTRYELPANKSQIKSRSLLYAFAIAAAKAKQQFGSGVKRLPYPIVVQAIQSNGQSYHFSVFQLNSLDLSEQEEQKNVWYEMEMEDLYTHCLYIDGKPHLENYNPAIISKFFTFYIQ